MQDLTLATSFCPRFTNGGNSRPCSTSQHSSEATLAYDYVADNLLVADRYSLQPLATTIPYKQGYSTVTMPQMAPLVPSHEHCCSWEPAELVSHGPSKLLSSQFGNDAGLCQPELCQDELLPDNRNASAYFYGYV